MLPPPLSHLFIHCTVMETPSGGGMCCCRFSRSKPSCHIHRTESVACVTVVKGGKMTATQILFRKKGRWNIFHGSDLYKYELWPRAVKAAHLGALFIDPLERPVQELLQPKVGYVCVWRKGKDMTECVLHGACHCCHGDSVTHSKWIWIYSSALFYVFYVWGKVCVSVCVIGYKCVYVQTRVHFCDKKNHKVQFPQFRE